jgi:CRP/FNR family cyclic AMP-dependent transcriptional regulator
MGTLGLIRHSNEVVTYTPGQAIFRKGQPGDRMYIVLEGEVDLIAGYTAPETAGPGSLLGEMALVDQRPRNASAIARTDCKLAPVDARRFAVLVQEAPLFAVHVMKTMADRLRGMDARLAA